MVQAFGREPHEDRRFGELTERTGRAYVRAEVLQLWFNASTSSVMAVGTVTIVLVGGLHVLDGRLSVGSLLVFLSYLASLYAPLETIASSSSGYAGAAAAARRVLSVLDTHDHVVGGHGTRSVQTSQPPGVVFDDVTFGYEPGVAVLKGISLDITGGETLALVGTTGSGKSTLVSLVPRLFDPWSGRILIDGIEIRDLRLEDLRAQVAIVLQEPFLFPLTIAENIAYGRPAATQAEVIDAARAAQADEFIRRLPQGYDTRIGERGVTLSGGERQRLSLARAFLKNAPILLLDEPTAALDLQTEFELIAAMDRLRQGRTSIIVAHRLSTIRSVDRIVVLETGQIVEIGTETELLAANEVYCRLHGLQTGSMGTPVQD